MANGTRARDDGLRTISRTTRWVTAAAVLASGAFTAVVARALPGKAKPASASADTQVQTSPGDQPASPGVSADDPSPVTPQAGDDDGPEVTSPPATTATTVSPYTRSRGNSTSPRRTLVPPRTSVRQGQGGGAAVSGGS